VQARIPSPPVLGCLGLCALILAIATVDLVHTESRLPDVSSHACPADDTSCRNVRLSEQLARDRAADPLQDQYDSRAWLYAFAILAAIAVTVAWILRTNPRTEWLRVFSNLGVTGVWLGIAVVVLLRLTDGSAVEPPPGPALLIPVALLVAAVAGTLIGRSEGWAERSQMDGVRDRVIHIGKFALHVGTAGEAKRSRLEELARWLSAAALALTAATCVFAFVFVLAQPGCDTTGTPPGWTNPIDSIAAVTAIGGMAAGIGTLILRHWIAALISLVACPVALLFVLASTCAFY
jgi:hypothetical protein